VNVSLTHLSASVRWLLRQRDVDLHARLASGEAHWRGTTPCLFTSLSLSRSLCRLWVADASVCCVSAGTLRLDGAGASGQERALGMQWRLASQARLRLTSLRQSRCAAASYEVPPLHSASFFLLQVTPHTIVAQPRDAVTLWHTSRSPQQTIERTV
jgi:hypothetical protein